MPRQTASKPRQISEIKKCKNIDLLLIGKTGHGKSATGNSILGRYCFETSTDVTSVTNVVQVEVCRYNNIIFKVVDAPGVADTSTISEEDKTSFIMTSMENAVKVNPSGYHAFLLVFRYDTRFTKEELESVKQLKKIFGQDIIRKYCILICSYGDDFRKKTFQSLSFQKWLRDQKGHFGNLVRECEYRTVLFDNDTEDEQLRNEQINNLITMIQSLKNNGRPYTDEHFKLAEKSRRSIMHDNKIELADDDLFEISLILQDAMSMSNSSEEDHLSEQVLNRIQNLISKYPPNNEKDFNLFETTLTDMNRSVSSFSDKNKAIKQRICEIDAQIDTHIHLVSQMMNKYTINKNVHDKEARSLQEKLQKIVDMKTEWEEQNDKNYELELGEIIKKIKKKKEKLIHVSGFGQMHDIDAADSDEGVIHLKKEIASLKLEKSICESKNEEKKSKKMSKFIEKHLQVKKEWKEKIETIKNEKKSIMNEFDKSSVINSLRNEKSGLKSNKLDLSKKLEEELRTNLQNYMKIKDSHFGSHLTQVSCVIL